MKPSEILSKAADLIEPEGKWTQRALWRNVKGNPCPFSEAVCWCAEGSIAAVSRNPEITRRSLGFLREFVGRTAINHWNDEEARTQSEVVSALRKASELAKQSEGA